MDVTQRVHIAPVSAEYDRVRCPIEEQRADVVYLLVHDDPDAVPPYVDDLRAELDEGVQELTVVETDFSDVYSVLGDVTTIAASHDGDDVYVNVSGAGTIPAIGATIACMDVSTDATAYYVTPESYTHDGHDHPITSGMESTTPIPTYPIDSPTPDQIAIMAFLADPAAVDERFETTRPKKSDLIEFARDEGLSFIADRNPSTDKGAFRVLDTHVVGPLVEDGYVTVERVGRRRLVELTERGENAYRAFHHKVDEA
ncbi:DUF6293 family protein [Halovivax cerinus]|uniref:DUF6293 family protein n=1 Tax=Halovivax cerinus TaxID=1487865 RepID=A0ABD5NJV4_9EURY|nr:DUF6293 family protein [Halovivax cerinus]